MDSFWASIGRIAETLPLPVIAIIGLAGVLVYAWRRASVEDARKAEAKDAGHGARLDALHTRLGEVQDVVEKIATGVEVLKDRGRK
jgi:hypothetical protein